MNFFARDSNFFPSFFCNLMNSVSYLVLGSTCGRKKWLLVLGSFSNFFKISIFWDFLISVYFSCTALSSLNSFKFFLISCRVSLGLVYHFVRFFFGNLKILRNYENFFYLWNVNFPSLYLPYYSLVRNLEGIAQ